MEDKVLEVIKDYYQEVGIGAEKAQEKALYWLDLIKEDLSGELILLEIMVE